MDNLLTPVTGMAMKNPSEAANVGVTVTSPVGIVKVALFVHGLRVTATSSPPQVTLTSASR